MTEVARGFGLILFSHGSLLCGAGEALGAHAARLRERREFDAVEVGYLNYSEPSFADAVARIATRGLRRVLVVPYFLAPGYFVSTSLPEAIQQVAPDFPDLEFVIAEPLGADARFADAVVVSALAPKPRERWRDGLNIELCRSQLDCPAYDTPDCPLAASVPRPQSVAEKDRNVLRTKPGSQAEMDQSLASRTALLVLAHGSPKAEANAPMMRVIDLIRERAAFHSVTAGFLECNAPDIPTAADTAATSGAERIVAVPYFLHTGKHVASDLPNLLDAAQARHPQVEFAMSEYLGASSLIADALADRAKEAMSTTQC